VETYPKSDQLLPIPRPFPSKNFCKSSPKTFANTKTNYYYICILFNRLTFMELIQLKRSFGIAATSFSRSDAVPVAQTESIKALEGNEVPKDR